jgi:hypothetical protein
MAAPKNNGKAIASLICGIIGLVLIFFTGGSCSLAGFILGIVAIILGIKAKKEIKANPTAFTGAGFATGGTIMGVVALILGILGFLLIIGIFLFYIIVYGVLFWTLL